MCHSIIEGLAFQYREDSAVSCHKALEGTRISFFRIPVMAGRDDSFSDSPLEDYIGEYVTVSSSSNDDSSDDSRDSCMDNTTDTSDSSDDTGDSSGDTSNSSSSDDSSSDDAGDSSGDTSDSGTNGSEISDDYNDSSDYQTTELMSDPSILSSNGSNSGYVIDIEMKEISVCSTVIRAQFRKDINMNRGSYSDNNGSIIPRHNSKYGPTKGDYRIKSINNIMRSPYSKSDNAISQRTVNRSQRDLVSFDINMNGGSYSDNNSNNRSYNRGPSYRSRSVAVQPNRRGFYWC